MTDQQLYRHVQRVRKIYIVLRYKIGLKKIVVLSGIIFILCYCNMTFNSNAQSGDINDTNTQTTVAEGLKEETKPKTKNAVTDYVPIGTYYDAINYSTEEFELFCQVAVAEAGVDGEDGVTAVMFAIRNDFIKNRNSRNGKLYNEITHLNGYETVKIDSDGNFVNVSVPSGEITFDDVPEEYVKIARKVLMGQVKDTTNGAIGFLPLEATTTSNVEDFAEKYMLPKGSYCQIGSQIYYKEWTEGMNNIEWNASW